MISRTTGILIGASLFAFVMFSSCNGMIGKGESDSTSIKEALEKAIVNTNEITVDSGGYKINLPKTMSPTNELNEAASLQYQNLDKELYIIIIDEPKVDFIKKFSEEKVYDDKLTPEKNYRIVQMEAMKEIISLRAEPGIKKTTINGLDAEIVDFSGTLPDIDPVIYYKLTFVEGTKNVYMIMTWTPASDKDKNTEEMDQMIQSFKLVE